MKTIDINSLKSPGGEVETFHGFEHEANLSFFVVHFPPGRGPKKHRHPYEETFIILEGEIEVMVDGQSDRIGAGKIAIIPAHTWHEFKNCSDKPLLLVNLHPVPKMITEWA
jgi:quercetin dioxygenase-like cupin family protein